MKVLYQALDNFPNFPWYKRLSYLGTGNKQEVQQELGLMEIGEDLCQDLLLLNPKILHGLRLLILLRDTMVQKTCVVSRLGLFCPTLMTNSHSNWFRKIVVKLNH